MNSSAPATKFLHSLQPFAESRHEVKSYQPASWLTRLRTSGVEARELVAADRSLPEIANAWIPGVEVFPRRVFLQRHRGFFAEFAREGEGVLGHIGLWPRQWAAATMFAGTAKGFHIHPPFIPSETSASAWFRRVFLDEPLNFALRPYDREQWDVMFITQGSVEFFLVDERAGLPRRLMRFWIAGDDHPGPDNAAIVIPPGVAHALRPEGSGSSVMTYGTSTVFDPDNEGRLFSAIETPTLPPDWATYLAGQL